VLEYLAVFLKSLNQPVRLVLIDGDKFEESNNSRMIFQDMGNKAEVKAADILDFLGAARVNVVPVPDYITHDNVSQLLRPGDLVFLCVDNHPTRKLVSDHCAGLDNITLFSGGNEGVEPPRERGTYGNVQIYLRRDGKDISAPLTKFHPEIANPKGKLPNQMSCVELALSTPQILFTNLAVASALLNAFFAFCCDQLSYQEVKFDILEARMLPQIPIRREEAAQQAVGAAH
jgi:hypothetical protein